MYQLMKKKDGFMKLNRLISNGRFLFILIISKFLSHRRQVRKVII